MQQGRGSGLDRMKVIGAFFAIYVVWGSTYLAIKIAVVSIPPLTAAGVRFLLAGLILYGVARLRGAAKPVTSEWRRLALLGAMMFVPTYSILFWAEKTIPSGLAAVVIATLPLWTAILEISVLKRQVPRPSLLVALAAGFIGVVLITRGSAPEGASAVPWVPCAALVVGEFFWAGGSILTKRLALPSSSAITAGAQMIVGGCLLLLCAVAIGERPLSARPTGAGLAAVAYMIVAGSIVAYSAYVWLLGRASATRLASYTYVNPVVALLIGYLLAGERLTSTAIYGSTFVLIGVILALRATRDSSASAPAGPRSGRELAPASARAT